MDGTWIKRAVMSGVLGAALALPVMAADAPGKTDAADRPERPARPEGGGGDVLGRIKAALADIKLTEDQQRKADEILAEAKEQMAGGGRGALQQVRKVVADLSAIMDEDQKLLLENKVRAAMAGGAGNQPGQPGGGRLQTMSERLKAATAELGLSEEQKKKVEELIAEMEKKVQELRSGGGDNLREKLMAMRDEGQEKMKAILSEEQFKKFTQAIQQGVPGGAGGGPRPGLILQNLQQAMSQLDLTEEQKNKLTTVRDEIQKKMEELRPEFQNGPTPELREKIRGIMEEMQKQLKEILTAEQQEKLRSLMPGAGGERPNRPGEQQDPNRAKNGL